MQDEPADTDRIEQLTDRIDRLESVAAAQQETITELRDSSTLGTWGRRGVLGSVAAVLGLSAASGSAAAGVGQIGTSSKRVDVIGDEGDFNTLEAANLTATGTTATSTKDPTRVENNRSKNTEYQAPNDANLIVSVNIKSDGSQDLGSILQVGNTSGSLEAVDKIEDDAASLSGRTQRTLGPYEVGAGMYYKILEFNGSGDILQWAEAAKR